MGRPILICLFLVLNFFTAIAQRLPQANKMVVDYVLSVMNTQVGTGECTDLIMGAQYHIRSVKTKIPKKKPVNHLPGDIITFNEVYLDNGLSFPQHYAIILEVQAENVFVIAHQNHNGNRSVSQLTVDLNQIISGKYFIQRPK